MSAGKKLGGGGIQNARVGIVTSNVYIPFGPWPDGEPWFFKSLMAREIAYPMFVRTDGVIAAPGLVSKRLRCEAAIGDSQWKTKVTSNLQRSCLNSVTYG